MFTYQNPFKFLFLLLGFFTLNEVIAQKKVLGLPEAFKAPKDYSFSKNQADAFLNETGTKSKKEAWIVISDRNENPIYDKPDGNEVGTIQFKEFFHVVDERGSWIKLVKVSEVNGLKILALDRVVGWVRKEKMLLWTNGLRDLRTNIHRKVLLLNRVDDAEIILETDDKERLLVKVYSSPSNNDVEQILSIYDFYFVLKKERERVLVSKQAQNSGFNIESSVVGWIPTRRSTRWDNRICLEPNHDILGYKERESNASARIKAFEDLQSAKAYAEGTGNEEKVYWEDDPVILPKSKLAESDYKRFKGDVMRFPMLSMQKSNVDFQYFRSGLIGTIKIKDQNGGTGDINENDYAVIKERVNKLKSKNNHVNVFFVIEGTDSVYAYKQAMLDALDQLRRQAFQGGPSIRYGALVYRDLEEENVNTNGIRENRLTEHISLTSDVNRVKDFISRTEFLNKKDRDNWTAMYHGLATSLKVAGFRENEHNIILMVGCYGDFKVNRFRREEARKTNHKALYEDSSPIIESLNKIDAHLHAVQLRNDGLTASRFYAKICQVLILRSAKYNYNKTYGNNDNPEIAQILDPLSNAFRARPEEPTIPEVDESNDISLLGATRPGRLVRPSEGRVLAPYNLKKVIIEDVSMSVGFNDSLYQILSYVIEKGGSFYEIDKLEADLKYDAGRFLAPVADFMVKMLEDKNSNKDDIKKSFGEKYRLFAEVYLPYKVRNTDYPAVSFTLFMPEDDLREYRRTIDRSISSGGSYSDKRKNLFEIYKELIIQFAGEDYIRDKRVEEITRGELISIMQGLEGTGLRIPVDLDFQFSDILDSKKISNNKIDELLQRFAIVGKELGNILRKGDNYEFSYQSPDGLINYYWIKIEDAF